MLLNIDTSVLQKVGALVSELRAQMRLMKSMGTRIMEQATLDRAQALTSHAVATIVYQSVIECTERRWLTI